MRFHFIHILRYQAQQPLSQEKLDSQPDSNDDRYLKEHERLEAIISDSEDIWEERTYQISAGGLSITFAIFSYLSSKGLKLDWQMVLIWSLYAFALLLNYVSHRISILDARKMQRLMKKRRDKGLPYNEDELNKAYSKQGWLTTLINWVVGLSLAGAVIYTIVYTCIHILSL